VVEAAMKRSTAWAIGLLALAYLAAMLITGAMPEQRQLVKFQAKGVMQSAPETIDRVEITQGERKATFVRTGDKTWKREGGAAVSAAAGERLSMAVQMMNTSGPVREIPGEELKGVDTKPFGLAPPQLAAVLYRSSAPVLSVRFGNRNPEGFMQYMAVAGQQQLYLMSGFVGEEWTHALQEALAQ
jgi:hypothetical protein